MSLESVKEALAQFPKVWDSLEIDERRELLRQLVEYLKVGRKHSELKLLFLPPVAVRL